MNFLMIAAALALSDCHLFWIPSKIHPMSPFYILVYFVICFDIFLSFPSQGELMALACS